jgi:hypothetical protein
MTEIMTPSEITDGQINKAVANYRALLEKHRAEMMSEPAQQVLGQSELATEMLGVLRRRIEMVSNQIVHIVAVNRKRTPKAALKASGRNLYVTDAVVEAMPRGTGDEVALIYFKPDKSAYKNGWLSCQALADEYKRRGLVPDPQAQIDDNAANPEFADTTPNACQWKDEDGNWCYAMFHRWNVERHVDVNRNDFDWFGFWSFAGIPQGSLS